MKTRRDTGLCLCGRPKGDVRSKMCVRCRAEANKTGTWDPQSTMASGMHVEGDKAQLVYLAEQPIKTLADLVRTCEIDTSEWDISGYTANKYEIAAKDDTGKLLARTLFQVKANMKRKAGVVFARKEIQALIEDAKKNFKPVPAPSQRRPQGEHLLEIAIPDLHIGKLAWGDETLGSNYDTKIACALYREALDALIMRTSAFRFNRVVITVGNDFFHSDTKAGTTTKGTPLDMDSRWAKTFSTGRKLMVESIEKLRHVAPVTVVMVPGNHDALSTFALGDSLECWYHATPDVTVMNEPSPRKYLQHGKVMLLWTHGDKGKLANLPLLMATEQPEMFGATKFREAHTGDKHQLRVQEHMGVRVRISPALCSADAWHSEHLFVGNQRAAEGFVWHPEEGLVSIATYTAKDES